MQQLYRLANVIGLDTTNAQHTLALREAMYRIKDTDDFINYCRSHKDGIEYSTKVEKLDTLSVRYKKEQSRNSLPHDTANTFSDGIVQKIKGVSVNIQKIVDICDRKEIVFSWGKFADNKPFTAKEKKALKELDVPVSKILDMAREHTLKEALVKLFINKHIQNSRYNALTDGQKEVKRLIGERSKK